VRVFLLSWHTLAIAAIAVLYVGLVGGLLGYLAWQVLSYRDPCAGDEEDVGDPARGKYDLAELDMGMAA